MSVEKGTVNFTSDTHLLEELGERLVASPSIAIAELIKNAYDADAVKCNVWENRKRDTIFIKDGGHGITKEEFLSRWMTVATQNKRDNPRSRKYNRVVTGAKGVGRFAARFLGKSLKLQSYSFDNKAKTYSKLEATFNWTLFDSGGSLLGIKIPYTYETGLKTAELGTLLEITDLRIEWNAEAESKVRREVLDICSPFPSLDHKRQLKSKHTDPGFSVVFAPPGEEVKPELDVASEVLERYLAKLIIDQQSHGVDYTIIFRDDGSQKKFHQNTPLNLVGSLQADIRYMPWGKGQFADFAHIKGTDAYQWVRENSGVKIFDHEFRVPPYGDTDDDWLHLAADSASNRRKWRSTIAETVFPRESIDKDESKDPALSLPINHQLIGAVFLNTDQTKKAGLDKIEAQKLQVAMDRQGYLTNEGYAQLVDIIRGGLELLAVVCKERDLKKKEEAAKAEASHVQKSFRQTITEVENSTLPKKEKKKVVKSLLKLEKDVRGLDAAHIRARESIELLGLLGGLAGFLTHETQAMLKTIDKLIHLLNHDGTPSKAELGEIREKAVQARQQLDDQLNYARTFLTGVGQKKVMRLHAHGQAQLVIDKMNSFTEPRDINPINDISKTLLSAPTMAVVYGGILMNLYTNAIKAVLARRDAPVKNIRFSAENDGDTHLLFVSDTGIGIPDTIRERIFDPLFTTTSDSALGSGMGLGLSIVKRLVLDLNGEIDLVRPEKGYSTTFRVTLPIKK